MNWFSQAPTSIYPSWKANVTKIYIILTLSVRLGAVVRCSPLLSAQTLSIPHPPRQKETLIHWKDRHSTLRPGLTIKNQYLSGLYQIASIPQSIEKLSFDTHFHTTNDPTSVRILWFHQVIISCQNFAVLWNWFTLRSDFTKFRILITNMYSGFSTIFKSKVTCTLGIKNFKFQITH